MQPTILHMKYLITKTLFVTDLDGTLLRDDKPVSHFQAEKGIQPQLFAQKYLKPNKGGVKMQKTTEYVFRTRRARIAAALLFTACVLAFSKNCTAAEQSAEQSTDRQTEQPASQGQIFLYGEEHSSEKVLERELQLWTEYYHEDGMRDLFVELPYYTAEYLNLWMQAEDDAILDELYQDWTGTLSHSEEVKEFYRDIKDTCPDTVFHGTDVGHQYQTTGARYLKELKENGQEASAKYQLASEAIEQGTWYYQHSDGVYRENTMAENFIREYDALNGASIMGIYGSAHTNPEAMDYSTGTVPCMAGQLHARYGAAVVSENLSPLAKEIEALRKDCIEIAGKEYEALYFGKTDLSAIFPQYKCREFWRLEDAYEDFKNLESTGNVLPYDNYPMTVETGQVFVIDYTLANDMVVREYYRSDGTTWQGSLTTIQIVP